MTSYNDVMIYYPLTVIHTDYVVHHALPVTPTGKPYILVAHTSCFKVSRRQQFLILLTVVTVRKQVLAMLVDQRPGALRTDKVRVGG